MKTYYIYIIKNTANKWLYVGQTSRTVETRWKEHLRSAKNGKKGRLYRAMRKHGIEKFSVETIAVVKDMKNDKVIFELEKEYIKMFNSYWFGYNNTTGGKGFLWNRPKRGRPRIIKN